MTCDILVRSYYKDLGWLGHCLRSIERWCTGFRRVIVVVPESTRPRLVTHDLAYDELIVCADQRDDYLGQQVTKLSADTLTDADVICHIDSDCVFRRPTTPDDLHDGGRLRQHLMPYEELPANIPWKRITEEFLGRPVEFEFMRRQPQAFPRWIYPELRAHARARHGRELADYVLAQPHRGFSEFNALGAYAYYFHHDEFAWVDLTGPGVPDPLCACFWSWGGIGPAVESEIEALLA